MNLLLIAALMVTDTATFAGGCFRSMERAFDQLDGVVSVTVGYAGGREAQPTYQQVSMGATGHLESVQIVYDPRKVSYERLLDAFWHNIDPTQADGQFCDHGPQYHTAVFYRDSTQHRAADASNRRREAATRHTSRPLIRRFAVVCVKKRTPVCLHYRMRRSA